MSGDQLIKLATAPAIDVVKNIDPGQLGAQTPCTDFDVRKLLNHILFWGPSLAGSARKQAVSPPAAAESEVDLVDEDWRAKVVALFEQFTESWSDPAAWEGDTKFGGPTEMPASLIGGMVVCEVIVHTTDLARATGQNPVWDNDLLDFAHGHLTATAQMGRDMGAFGPEVPVPDSAPMLARILGLTGRAAGPIAP
jgi:uncharacterized protein (TIGR03086 family)